MNLFATSSDWKVLLSAVEAGGPIVYTDSFTQSTPQIPQYQSCRAGLPLDVLRYANNVGSRFYYVWPRSQTVPVRSFRLISGGVRYNIHPEDAVGSVHIGIGGLVDDQTLLSGSIGTKHCDSVAQELLSRFRKARRNLFGTVNRTAIGPEALQLLRSGGRLTSGITRDRIFDLRELEPPPTSGDRQTSP